MATYTVQIMCADPLSRADRPRRTKLPGGIAVHYTRRGALEAKVRAGSPEIAAARVRYAVLACQWPGGAPVPRMWFARRRWVPQIGPLFTRAGSWPDAGGGDDGSAGVREPRRPIPPHGSESAELDLP